MSCVKSAGVEIELTDFEKHNLLQAYRILKNISQDMWEQNLEDTEEAYKTIYAKESLGDFLKNCLGIEDYD